MIRVVVAVAVAAAVLAASLPAIETARVERTTAALDRISERIDRAALTTLASEPGEHTAAGGLPTARRVVSISVPRRSLAAAGIRVLAVCPGENATGAVFVRAVGHAPTARTPLAAPYDVPTGGIVFPRRGTVHLALVPVAPRPGAPDANRYGGRRVRLRLVGVSAAGAGSSTGTGARSPCDSSTSSVTASAGKPATGATAEATVRTTAAGVSLTSTSDPAVSR